MDEKLIDEKRKTITKIIITNENIRLRVIVDPCGTCQKQNGMPHAAKSKYINNNTYINITRLRYFLFVGCDNVSAVRYGRQIRLTRDLLLCKAYMGGNKTFWCLFRQKRSV